MDPAVLELDPGAYDEVFDRARGEQFAGSGRFDGPGGDLDRHAGDVCAEQFAFARAHAGAHLHAERTDPPHDVARAMNPLRVAGYFCEPPSRAHERGASCTAKPSAGAEAIADLGPKLPALLRRAGLERIGVSISQEYALDGDPKLIPPLTLERIADAVSAEGAASDRGGAQTIDELYALSADPYSLMDASRRTGLGNKAAAPQAVTATARLEAGENIARKVVFRGKV
jgi:hypothetical protein